MTEHLPECQPKSAPDPPFICICPELRACEERAIAAAVQRLEAREYLTADFISLKGVTLLRVTDVIAAIQGDRP